MGGQGGAAASSSARPSAAVFHHQLVFLTGEEVVGAQEADAQPEDGQLVQAGDDVLGERQQAGEPVQLRVQAVAVPFGRVGLGAVSRGRFDSGEEESTVIFNPGRHHGTDTDVISAVAAFQYEDLSKYSV